MSASFPSAVPIRILTGIASYGAMRQNRSSFPQTPFQFTRWDVAGRKASFWVKRRVDSFSAGVSENGGHVCVLPGT